MPRAKTNKTYRTFVKGLITEAGYLTYPEEASTAESNTILSRKGNRTRRLGIDYEDDYLLKANNFVNEEYATNEYVWSAVNNKPDINFLVVQTGSVVRFFLLTDDAISNQQKSFTVNLETYVAPGYTVGNIVTSHCEFASGKGFLFIAHKYVETLLIEYDPILDTITTTQINVLIRDFDGVIDGLSNEEEPLTLTKEHHYNLQNQGWVSPNSNSSKTPSNTVLDGYTFTTQYITLPFGGGFNLVQSFQGGMASSPITKFKTVTGRYPGNNKQWWIAKSQSEDTAKGIKIGDFLPDILDKQFSGNARAPRGHYILSAFQKDRSAVSGISGLPVETVGERPNAVAFFSGRAWYACNSSIYYSQILENKTKAGLCYQEADPTSEDISDLIASDGGVIPIPEATKIIKLVAHANGMMVFAMNGVWFIYGGSSGFTATDISTDKVSVIGSNSPLAIVRVDDSVFWWSEVGIHALQQASGAFGPIPGKFGNTNIAEQTVQTLYNGITDNAKAYTKGCYDPKNNVIYWLYADDDIEVNYRYNNVLLYDVTLQAFYTWTVAALEDGPVMSGIFLETGLLSNQNSENVVASGVNVTASAVVVSTSIYDVVVRPTNVVFTTAVEGVDLTFSKFVNTFYMDWQSFNGTGVAYESYVETGFELLEDIMRRKQAVYCFIHMRRTEDDPLSPESTCTFTAKWDWSANSNTNKWTQPVEAYRPRKFIQSTTADNEGGFPVVISKNKVRGGGKSLQFRFGTSEPGKTFDLLGWAVAYVGNTEP